MITTVPTETRMNRRLSSFFSYTYNKEISNEFCYWCAIFYYNCI